jgi:D-glycero-alpha-D-manno-heptose 1-phosphate guanylyltransferase
MISREAVVLAGGFGTRLRSEVSDVPKPMAPISGRPFLEYLLSKLESQGINHVVLSVGYRYESIIGHFGRRWRSLSIDYFVEEHPLGTGGGLVAAFGLVHGDCAFALNGDTLLHEDFATLSDTFRYNQADIAMFVREIEDCERYGICELDGDRLSGFSQGSPNQAGCINAGVYLAKTKLIRSIDSVSAFSFDTDYLPEAAKKNQIFVKRTTADFIDIGIPESFKLAQSFIPSLSL